jgi:hypothetical protein
MDKTKIRLSPEETALVTRADWILTKNTIIRKAQQLLAMLQEQQYRLLNSYHSFPEQIIHSSPKISKGENYKGLPYVVLDYPRSFSKEDVFAIRTLFWWGNFFSVTLHIAGSYKNMYGEKIARSFESIRTTGFFVCISEDQWEHHFEADNYQSLEKFAASAFEEMITQKPFIKLSKKIPLHQWNDAEKTLLEIFSQLIDAMKN